MFSENLVPTKPVSIRKSMQIRTADHSVSAFGSSIGTAIRWSAGAAILSSSVKEGQLLSGQQCRYKNGDGRGWVANV